MRWTEERFVNSLKAIANLCAAGLLDSKEAALEDVLDASGWTRNELKDLNRRREAKNN